MSLRSVVVGSMLLAYVAESSFSALLAYIVLLVSRSLDIIHTLIDSCRYICSKSCMCNHKNLNVAAKRKRKTEEVYTYLL